MKIAAIVAGVLFIILTILIIIADNVTFFGYDATTNFALRNTITVIFALLGVILITIGAWKVRTSS